jgi:hypothetical protein
MPRNALIYGWAIIATGIAVLVCALASPVSLGPDFFACLALASLAATFKMKLPKLTTTISPAFVFVLVSVATLSWSQTVLISAASALVQCLWHPKKRPTWLQLAFNAAAMAIVGGAAHAVTGLLTVKGGTDVLVVALGAAGVTLLMGNTLIVSTILCLLKEAPFMTVWRSVQLWMVPYYLAGGALANVWARAQLTPFSGVIILAPLSVYLLSVGAGEVVKTTLQTPRRAS